MSVVSSVCLLIQKPFTILGMYMGDKQIRRIK